MRFCAPQIHLYESNSTNIQQKVMSLDIVTSLSVARVVEKDRSEVCRLTRGVHEEGIFRDIAFSETKFNGFFSNTLNDPKTYLSLKVERDGRVVGCSYCIIGGYFIGEDA